MYALFGRVLVRLMRLVTGVQVRGLDVAPEASGAPRVYIANHSSHLDGLVVWAALPPEARALTRPVAAGDYWTSNRVRSLLARRVFNVVMVGRGADVARDTIPRLVSILDEGFSLIVFPEGTRGGHEDGLGTFQSGIYHLASERPHTDFVPVLLENLDRAMPKGKVIPVPILGRASFGAPFRIAPGEARSDFLDRARAAVLASGEATSGDAPTDTASGDSASGARGHDLPA